MSFAKDELGRDSSTRLIFIIGSLWAMLMTTGMAFYLKSPVGELVAFYGAIQGILVGLKLGQKNIEKPKNENNDE